MVLLQSCHTFPPPKTTNIEDYPKAPFQPPKGISGVYEHWKHVLYECGSSGANAYTPFDPWPIGGGQTWWPQLNVVYQVKFFVLSSWLCLYTISFIFFLCTVPNPWANCKVLYGLGYIIWTDWNDWTLEGFFFQVLIHLLFYWFIYLTWLNILLEYSKTQQISIQTYFRGCNQACNKTPRNSWSHYCGQC